MDGLIQFSIPIRGLRTGIHQFDFHIDRSFFQYFEHSPVAEGNVDMTLFLDKRPDMYVLQFDFKGTVRTECDRCLAEIDLSVSGSQRLLVKFSEEEEPEDADVIFISPETQQLNVARYAYEYVVLSMPMIKVYDCEKEDPPVCNQDMLKYLERAPGGGGEEKEEEGINPIWEELKKFNNN